MLPNTAVASWLSLADSLRAINQQVKSNVCCRL